MLKKVKFIYNPSSGETVVTEYLDQIIELFQQNGYSIVPYRLTFDGAADDIIGDLTHDYSFVMVAGGDGTINYVVNQLMGCGIDIPLAVLPTGTANDFATMLEMPTDIMKACKAVIQGREIAVDVGVVNGTRFVNVFSCGLFTDISQKTPTIVKNNFGKLAYYLNGLGELPRFRKMNLTIHTDGGDFEGQALIFFVFNGRYAGNLPLAYLSEIDDGKLDVIVLKGDTPLETLQTAVGYLNRARRKKEYPDGIVHMRCSRLTAHSAGAETTDIDGQPGPGFPIDIRCEAGMLRVIAPVKSVKPGKARKSATDKGA